MIHYNNLAELHKENMFPAPEFPLFSIYQCNQECPIGDREFTSDFYLIGLKKLVSGTILYGRTQYDHQCGSMLFFKPRQVIEMKNLHLEEDGFLIFIHEDFFNANKLHSEIKNYQFFDYEINEALHLSQKEEQMMWEVYRRIEIEYYNNQDEHSRDIILINVSTILNYAQRFYKRQFLDRNIISSRILTKFKAEIDLYVESGLLKSKGLPSVQYLAQKLRLTPGYLTDLLKQESGKTAIEHIHIYLISEAKNLLKTGRQSVSEIAHVLGFENLSYFSRLFKKEVGVSPIFYKKELLN